MLVTFLVLWPFAAASLFAFAKFFDRVDRQLVRVEARTRR